MYSPNEQNINAVKNPATPVDFILELLANDEKRFWKSYIPDHVASPLAHEHFLNEAIEDARIRSEKRGMQKPVRFSRFMRNPYLSADFLKRLVNEHGELNALKHKSFTLPMLKEVIATSNNPEVVAVANEQAKFESMGLRQYQ